MDNRHHNRHHERWNTLGTPCDYAHNASQEDPKGVYSEEKTEVKLVSRGLLLHMATGGLMCEMSVELKKEPVQLKICVDDFVSGALTPSALCQHLHRLLKCDDLYQ